jgi:hypothetical protein
MQKAKEEKRVKEEADARDTEIRKEFTSLDRNLEDTKAQLEAAKAEMQKISDSGSETSADRKRYNILDSNVKTYEKRIEAYEADSDRATRFDRYSELVAEDKKVEEAKAKKAEEAKKAKEAKVYEAKNEEAMDKAGELVTKIEKAMNDGIRIPEGKLSKADKKHKKELMSELDSVLSSTSTNALDSLSNKAAISRIAKATGLNEAEVSKSVKDAMVRRKRSAAVMGDKSTIDKGTITELNYGGEDPGVAFAGIMTKINEAILNLREADADPDATIDIADVNTVKSGWMALANLVRDMSRADFARFTETGNFSSELAEEAGIKFDVDAVLATAGDRDGGAREMLKRAIAYREKRDNSVSEKKKYVSNIARAEVVMRQNDIDHARDVVAELVKSGDITQSVADTLLKRMDEVEKRSKDAIKKASEEATKEAVKTVEDSISELAEDVQMQYEGRNPFLKAQMMAMAGPTGNILDSKYILGIEDKDGIISVKVC